MKHNARCRPARTVPHVEMLEDRVLAAAGALDATFSTDGRVLLDPMGGGTEQAVAVVVQGDGKIVVAGFADDATAQTVKMRVSRFHPGGALDPAFDHDGSLLLDIPTTDFAKLIDDTVGLALQDGKLLVAGSVDRGGGDFDFVVARLSQQNGALDPTFGTGGVARVNFNLPGGVSDDRFRALTLDRQGRIVLAGIARTEGQSGTQSHVAVARLNGPDGSLDTSFGIGGKFTQEGNAAVTGVAMQDDQILVAGSGGWRFLVGRLTATGTLDTTFADGGWHEGHFNNPDRENGAQAVAVQPWDNKIVIVGVAGVGGGGTDFAVARLDANGRLDPTFDDDGTKHFAFSNGFTEDHAYSVVLQDDRKLLVSGFNQRGISNPTEFGFAVARLTEDGGFDSSFDGDGKVSFIFPGPTFGDGDDKAFASVLQRDGKLVVVGHTFAELGMKMAVARLEADPRALPPREELKPPAPPARPIMGRLVMQGTKGKKRLFLRLSFADTGELIWEKMSPFQLSVYRAMAVTAGDGNGDGVADMAVLTARKGTRMVRHTFTA